jgi:hypothetical protein
MATTTPYKTTFADQVETYQAAINSLFSGKPEDTEAELSKLFAPHSSSETMKHLATSPAL